jgi:hypothetical protein
VSAASAPPPAFHLVARTGHPDFLDFPWQVPLEEWDDPRLIDVARGISRHVVRFVASEGRAYALKETSLTLAEREYGLLRRLAELNQNAVQAVGVVRGRTDAAGNPLGAVLITAHLDFSLPYRWLFTGRGLPDIRARLIDALAGLLVRLHLDGFFWGDCSLSNVLFRRDAGALAAYLVDAETGEFHPRLSVGQRAHDLSIATENIGGELLDLAAARRLPTDVDPLETPTALEQAYESLWDELTRVEEIGLGERHKVEDRLRRLNQLGFDVEEFEVMRSLDGEHVRVHALVLEEGHHSRRLQRLTGLSVQENQARRLLNDLTGYRLYLEQQEGRPVPEAVGAYRWLTEVFEPALERVPDELRGKLEPAELFHEILEHRWFLSELRGTGVETADAVDDYVRTVLLTRTDEFSVLPKLTDDAVEPEEASKEGIAAALDSGVPGPAVTTEGAPDANH